MPENHEGKRLREFILMNEVNVDRDLMPKIDKVLSKATFYKQFKEEKIKPEYRAALLKAGIDFLGQLATTRLKTGLQFNQKETGMSERVTALEAQVAELQRSLLDLYSRLPKQN